MKDNFFSVLQRVGRSFMLPIAILPIAGLLLGLGASFTNPVTIQTYGLGSVLGKGTVLNALLMTMSSAGGIIFNNLPIIFAIGVAIGMAKAEKEVAALSAAISFFAMNVSIRTMLLILGVISPDKVSGMDESQTVNLSILSKENIFDALINPGTLEGTITEVCGITTLQMGVFGGILVGIGVAMLHNRYYKIVFPDAFSFFGGVRFVPIICTVVYLFVGIAMTFIWPLVQHVIFALGNIVTQTGYIGTLIFGIIKRALIPLGLHHVFYLPFWQTAVGGSMMVDGQLVQGGQNIFFAQLASPNVTHFSADATRYFSGEFIFMIFGLPGAALAMYRCARPEKKKVVGGLLFSAALTSMFTGITEPIEFSFLFVAPMLFAVQVVLAGTAYMIAHMLNIAVGLTFSAGLLDLFIFGVLQGNNKTGWMLIIPIGIVYFFLYYFSFSYLIRKFDFKTPGREEDDEETKLYNKADYIARKDAVTAGNDELSAAIVLALGGKSNIASVDCCATRLRVSVENSALVDKARLNGTGASGVIVKGTGVQVIYGPKVAIIKTNLEEYLASAPDVPSQAKGFDTVSEAPLVTRESPTATQQDSHVFYAPIGGTAHVITEAPDEAFAGRMMGDGFFISPAEDTVVAPCDATVAFVSDTKHALGLETAEGDEFLIHFGIDTVKLNGKGFKVFVQEGQHVKKGEKLMQADLDYIRKNAPSDVCIVVFTGGQTVRLEKSYCVKALDAVACYQAGAV